MPQLLHSSPKLNANWEIRVGYWWCWVACWSSDSKNICYFQSIITLACSNYFKKSIPTLNPSTAPPCSKQEERPTSNNTSKSSTPYHAHGHATSQPRRVKRGMWRPRKKPNHDSINSGEIWARAKVCQGIAEIRQCALRSAGIPRCSLTSAQNSLLESTWSFQTRVHFILHLGHPKEGRMLVVWKLSIPQLIPAEQEIQTPLPPINDAQLSVLHHRLHKRRSAGKKVRSFYSRKLISTTTIHSTVNGKERSQR